MSANDSTAIIEEQQEWMLSDLFGPHPMARSYYMRPEVLPQESDREYRTDAEFWNDVLDETLDAERVVRFTDVRIFDWLPRNPGLFHTHQARHARHMASDELRSLDGVPIEVAGWHSGDAQRSNAERESRQDVLNIRSQTRVGGERSRPPRARSSNPLLGVDLVAMVPSRDAPNRRRALPRHSLAGLMREPHPAFTADERRVIYTPKGKNSMLQGGIGCIRLKSLEIVGRGTAWMIGASFSDSPDQGVPVMIGNADYRKIRDELHDKGCVNCDLVGRTRYIPERYRDLFSARSGIPRLYIEISALRRHRPDNAPVNVSVAASFLSEFEGQPHIYASYVTFDPGLKGAFHKARDWLRDVYVEELYQGQIITDFDQRAPAYADTLFSLDDVLRSSSLAKQIKKLSELYGSFQWKDLDRFTYIEHQGDVIVNNTITVTDSQNVVIQSTLHNAQLNVTAMPAADDDTRRQLAEALDKLKAALEISSSARSDDAEAVGTQADVLIAEAAKPKPNKSLLQSMTAGLKAAASFLKDTAPAGLTAVDEIIAIVKKVHDLVV
jgi:hypothetical protein